MITCILINWTKIEHFYAFVIEQTKITKLSTFFIYIFEIL